jgi:hypothetical protein
LQYDTSYAGLTGGFAGAGNTASCQRLAGDFAAFNDVEAESRLASAFISSSGLTGPVDVATCDYTGALPIPEPSDFVIQITDQTRPDLTPGNATVAVTAVDCTCTTGTTSTTTTTIPAGDLYDIEFSLDDAVTVGSLQLEIDYSSADGSFVGEELAVSCTSPLTAGGALVSFYDVPGGSQLNFAAIDDTGFTGPTVLADCEFAGATAPTAGEFTITVIDANEPDFTPIDPAPAISVSSIMPQEVGPAGLDLLPSA